MICVPDLDRGVEAYTRLGFSVRPGGVHAGKGTHNAIAFFDEDYLELIAIRDRDEYVAHSAFGGLLEIVKRGGGLRYIIVQSDDLAADVAAMRARGIDVSDPAEGSRRTPAGKELRWCAAVLGKRHPLPFFFIEHLTPLAERRGPAAVSHPNGITRVDRAYVTVTDVRVTAQDWSRVLGIAVPKIERGTVINADMAVFNLGNTGVVAAQPVGPGPAADALSRFGPGPFQVLYRTTGMEAAARWMGEHGVPPPARGTRNTGEQAMLVAPEFACGAYIGFVGPA